FELYSYVTSRRRSENRTESPWRSALTSLENDIQASWSSPSGVVYLPRHHGFFRSASATCAQLSLGCNNHNTAATAATNAAAAANPRRPRPRRLERAARTVRAVFECPDMGLAGRDGRPYCGGQRAVESCLHATAVSITRCRTSCGTG